MPVYEYACGKCEHEFEVSQRITDDPIKTCPKCRSRKVKKLISQTSFVLKGGGWYADAYSSTSGKSAGDSGADSEAKSGSDSKADPKSSEVAKSDTPAKTETKSEKKPTAKSTSKSKDAA